MTFTFICASCGYTWDEAYSKFVFTHTEGDCPSCGDTVCGGVKDC